MHTSVFTHAPRPLLSPQELLKYDLKDGLETRHAVTPYYCRTDRRVRLPGVFARNLNQAHDFPHHLEEVVEGQAGWRRILKGDSCPVHLHGRASYTRLGAHLHTGACVTKHTRTEPPVCPARSRLLRS